MTTMLGNFKLGPAKTRDGKDIDIVKLEGHRVYPIIALYKTHYDEWICGAFKTDAVIPNAEPERVEFEEGVRDGVVFVSGAYKDHGFLCSKELRALIGKRCKVTVEVLDD